MKTGQIRRIQKLDKLGRHVIALNNSSLCFLIDLFKKKTVLRYEIRLCQKTTKFLLAFFNTPSDEARFDG